MNSSRLFLSGVFVGICILALVFLGVSSFATLPPGDAFLCVGVGLATSTYAYITLPALEAGELRRSAVYGWLIVVAALAGVFVISIPVGKAEIGVLLAVAAATVMGQRLRPFRTQIAESVG